MISGSINFKKDEQKDSCLTESVSEVLHWDSCHKQVLNWNDFTGIIYTDSRLPGVKDDCILIDEKNGLAVIFDGWIYNYRELAKELNIHGKVMSMPRLVWQAWLKLGVSFADKLNGDFAICIYDKREQKAFLFRDHLGIRPLAIAFMGSTLFFATDPMGLCKALFKEEPVDPDFLLNLFFKTGNDFQLLPNKKVFHLKPGHYFTYSVHCQECKRYWFPEKIKKDNTLTSPQVFSELDSLVRDAVKIRCDLRYKASAHVSGGLDSGMVAALARQEYHGRNGFYGFSWTPDLKVNPDKITHDERLLVEETCRKKDIKPIFLAVDADDYMAFVQDWRHRSELLFERKTIQAAKARGVNLMFSGWGGDEFISTGHEGIDPDLIRDFDWGSFLKKYPPRQFKRFVYALLFNALFPSVLRTWSKYRMESTVSPYLKKRIDSNRISRRKRFHYHSRRNVHFQLLHMGHLQARTSDWYVHGQRNGMEYRYPLLDKRIVEYMLKVPSRCLVGGIHHRIILRQLGKGLLPDEVLKNRSKNDPVKNHFIYSIVNGVKESFINELDEYRNNPDLNFIDFELLTENLPKILLAKDKEDEIDESSIFYYLKAAHEFTKGYYDKK